MGIFRRGRSERDGDVAPDATTPADDEVRPGGDAAPDRAEGPRDRSAVDDDSGYLNLGAIWLRGQSGMELRLEVNEKEKQVTGVTAVLGDSAVQIQAFAAPRTEGVWIDVRNELAASITGSGGTAEVVTGPFGEELQARMPQKGSDGRVVFVPARFLGVDGPRWFLRAVVTGRAAVEPAAAESAHALIRSVVVDRDDEARPPRELLPLRLPDQAQARRVPPPAGQQQELRPFERGPEITEVR